MNKLCIFAGTTEGRRLAELLSGQQVEVSVCVATDYGQELLPQGRNLTVRAGRMTQEDMEEFLKAGDFQAVVDATHPYASAVTENIRAACDRARTPYLRLLRSSAGQQEDGVYVPDIPSAVAYLEKTQGNILLTTGSKELAGFSGLRDFADRVYARVLPMEDSLRLCREAGLPSKRIIAMQGPFSEELNRALIRSVNAAYLVTKDSGAPGGYGEKAQAAAACGCRLVVIGRPPQVTGLDLEQTVRWLKERFDLTFRPRVSLVGIGPGDAGNLTQAASRALQDAQCLIGAKRMTAMAGPGQQVFEAVEAKKIADYIHAHQTCRNFAVALSGDTGFFSGAKKLLPLLSDCDVTVLPGISSLSCLCARLGTGYEDVQVLSLHGRTGNLGQTVRRNRRVFILTGGDNRLDTLCRQLTDAGLGDTRVSAGERLGYPEEKITRGLARELRSVPFDSLTVALLEREEAQGLCQGLPDEAFLRAEGVPMTKSETRAVCLSKLALPREAVCWDIGAGTGSVSVEMALAADKGSVYAVERKEAAVAVLEENCRRFGLENVTVVPGLAPECCASLPSPTHVFIGGSSGAMEPIVALALEKNPKVRIVATAVTLETVGELNRLQKAFDKFETVSLYAAKDRQLGGYTLMTGQNPIYIFTMEGRTGRG